MPKRAANLKDRSQRALTSVSNAVQNTGWTMDSSWKLLNSHYGNRTNPPLLIKYDFSLASYTVSLTDLTYLWTETLDRRQVIKRALNLETSIDPSEDGSQMQLLLRRIREAFEGREGTSITINGEGDSDKLILTACITLPSPLLPLEWPITCIRASQSAFTTQFVLPSLALCSLASAQVTSLLQHLKDKEYVINKLVDKIQSDGTDLSKIFPGVPLSKAGSKVNARGVAAKSVRGLAEFDEIQWRSRLASGNDTSSDINDLVSSVFGSDSPITSQDYGRFLLNCEGWKRSEPEDKSWSKSGNQSSTTSFESKPLQAKPQPEADVLDGFQRQITPPRQRLGSFKASGNGWKTKPSLPSTNEKTGDSTTDESDEDKSSDSHSKKPSANGLDLPVRPNTCLQPTTTSLATDDSIRKPKLGTAESPNNQSPKDSLLSPPELTQDFEQNEAKASPPIPVSSDAKKPPTPAKPKHRLGVIGGKAKADSAHLEDTKVKEEHIANIPPIRDAQEKHGTEAISGDRDVKEAHVNTSDVLRPRQASPRKVSEEQANENRKRLQRELESTSKIANKRKRRF